MARSFDAGSNAACLTAHKRSRRGFGAHALPADINFGSR